MSTKLIDFESDYWSRDQLVLGIDEAGYGCLAGSMFIAGVIYPKNFIPPTSLQKINDSKKLSEKTRFLLRNEILKYAMFSFVIEVSVDKINNENPYWLRYTETSSYLDQIVVPPQTVVIYDGDRALANLNLQSESLIKGDSKSFSIASASILAKTSKDAEMAALDKSYPMYNFISNKGYGTAAHSQALKKHGLSPVHRPKYCSNILATK